MEPARRESRVHGMSPLSGERWRRFSERIENEFGLVLALVLAAYVIASVAPYNFWRPPLVATVTSVIAIIALGTAAVRPTIVRWAVWLAVAAVALAALSVPTDEGLIRGLSALIQVALLTAAAAALLRAVIRARDVGFGTILGAISVYIMLGLLFTFLYYGVDQLQSERFFGGGANANADNLLFFSITTLTGTGYGDLVPAGQPGKMFAGLEMLIGQMFLVTLIAGLVSLWRPLGGFGSRAARQQHHGREEDAGHAPGDQNR